MKSMKSLKHLVRMFVAAAVLVLNASYVAPAFAQFAQQPTQLTAPELRVLLSKQLSEHVLLFASATGASVDNRQLEADAAYAALDENSVALSKSVGVVYGADGEALFLPLWRKHITIVQEYVTAIANKDEAKADKSLQALVDYSREFGGFVAAANPNLPRQVVVQLAADLVKEHVLELKDIITAQFAGDQAEAYRVIRRAFRHMDAIAGALADVITKQYPAKYLGKINSPQTELQVQLNGLFGEHVYLLAWAANASIAGRADEAAAARQALEGVTTDLADAVGAMFGDASKMAFLPAWSRLNTILIAYADGLAAQDPSKMAAGKTDAGTASRDVAALFSSVSPKLDRAASASAIQNYTRSLIGVMDALAAGEQADMFELLGKTYTDVTAFADPLVSAAVAQSPDQYGDTATTTTGMGSMDHANAPLPVTGVPQSELAMPVRVRFDRPVHPQGPAVNGTLLTLLDHALIAYEHTRLAPVAGNKRVAENPVRLSIPSIGLNTPILRVALTKPYDNGQTEWQVPDFRAVGWHDTSARLGASGNMVLNGHHNTNGNVFANLKDVRTGDRIMVSGRRHNMTYVITVKEILPENGQPEFVRAEHARLIAHTADDRLTLVTCWPPNSNTHRLIVIAKPITDLIVATQAKQE